MPDQAIEMLIVSNAMSEAESYLSALRNAGMAVHLTRIDQDTKAFRKTIDSDTPFDLLLLTTRGQQSRYRRCHRHDQRGIARTSADRPARCRVLCSLKATLLSPGAHGTW